MSDFYKKDKGLVIAIDFDGTCVKHKYPLIGEDIGAIPVLKELIDKGHSLILYTMRDGYQLEEALDWFKDNEIPLYSYQINPTQDTWTTSNKCYAHTYIDDAGLGCPLITPKDERPWVDWKEVRNILKRRYIL